MIKRTLYHFHFHFHFHFCCGLGGGAKGFNQARPRVGNVEAEWECLGGIDVAPASLADFSRLAGVPGTLLDLFTRNQYIRFHGKEPPPGWREATPEYVRRGPRAMLENLMRWHGIEEQAEAIQLLIMHAHDLGPEGSAPLLAIPRHDFKPSDFVARQLERLGRQEAARLDQQDQ